MSQDITLRSCGVHGQTPFPACDRVLAGVQVHAKPRLTAGCALGGARERHGLPCSEARSEGVRCQVHRHSRYRRRRESRFHRGQRRWAIGGLVVHPVCGPRGTRTHNLRIKRARVLRLQSEPAPSGLNCPTPHKPRSDACSWLRMAQPGLRRLDSTGGALEGQSNQSSTWSNVGGRHVGATERSDLRLH